MLGNVLKIVVPVVALLGVIGLMVVATQGVSMPVIDTRGIVGDAQRDTLYFAVLTMLIIVLPVFFLLFFIAFRYRDSNKRAKYTPDWASNRVLEAIWWGVPIIIILVLSVLTWKTSHSLDPYRPLESSKTPLNIQVVALQWKWLFIYPDHDVASIGEFAMPVDTPVNFTITSDAPMNSFWIPQLGGQVYAMAGMSTKLHLSARMAGEYRGSSANISGEGHSSMTFTARAMSGSDFAAWITQAGKSSESLDATAYESLRLPSKHAGVKHYRLSSPDLYETIVGRYSGSHGGRH
jgi:cytochrome o ubiquinol oxidase subunit 2